MSEDWAEEVNELFDAKDVRIADLEAALRPFVEYRAWARRCEWPADIAGDPSTPVAGHDNGPPGSALYVRDFDRAAAVLQR